MSFSEAIAGGTCSRRTLATQKKETPFMRWIMRHVVFVLCLSLGSTTWYILAQKASTHTEPTKAIEAPPVHQTIASTDDEQPEFVPGQSIKFGPVGAIGGYVNTQTVILRESADAQSPVVAKLKSEEYGSVEILGATGDFLHVRFTLNASLVDDMAERKQVYEGWTAWGSVMPELSAIVLDAETGAVVSRIPLGEGIASIAYSPDGKRAIFYSGSIGRGQSAYEVRTSDYTLTRSLTPSDTDYLTMLFYGPANGDLYATVHTSDEAHSGDGKLSLTQIGEYGAANIPLEFNISPSNFAISPDGLIGFVWHAENGSNEMVVNVIELNNLKIRNTFTLPGESLPANSGSFVLNRDGSELYVRLSENTGTISVINTRTGQLVREIPDSATGSWSHFSLVGDSLLLRVWEGNEDEMHSGPHLYWLGKSKRVAAEGGITDAVEAGGKRYAVNANGTLLFKLDASNHIQERLMITRPDLPKGATEGNDLSVFGLSASPDGKRIIMFIGMEHGC
jgi:DNA-binding beta-propeller fold protein YncE